jgi:hypothetical protein
MPVGLPSRTVWSGHEIDFPPKGNPAWRKALGREKLTVAFLPHMLINVPDMFLVGGVS